MPIKAANIILKPSEPVANNSSVIGPIKASNFIVGGKIINDKELTTKNNQVVSEKYKIKTEGELIMSLNSKSDYLNDILDLDQN
jgi:hypothetical protein